MTRACHGPIRAAVGDAFSDEEIEDALARLAARHRRKTKADPSMSDEAAWREAMEEVSGEMLEENLAEARMRRFAAAAKADRERAFEAMYARGYDEASALRMINVGEESDAPGSGRSVDAIARAEEAELVGALLDDLSEAGVFKRLMHWTGRRDKDFEFAVAEEVSRLNGAQVAAATDDAVVRAAAAIKRALDAAKDRQNAQGAFIRTLDGYVVRQSHDPIKIGGGFWRGMASSGRDRARGEWVDFIRSRLDERSFDGIHAERARRAAAIADGGDRAKVDPEGFARMSDDELERTWLEGIWYDVVRGQHEVATGALDDLDGFRPPPGKARSVSKGRTLHFRDARAWFDYNERYGRGSLMEAVLGQVHRGARNAALMQVWGPNPRAAFDAHLEAAGKRARQRRADPEVGQRLANWLRQAEFEQLDGSAEAPESVRVAAVSRAIRNQQQLAKLGGVVISAQTDTAFAANALRRAGVDYLDAYSHIYKAAAGLDGEAARNVADELGVAALTMAGDVSSRFNALDGAQGVMSRMLSVFYRANLFQFWNERVRRGAGVALARHLGRQSDRAFAALDASTRGALERYGINAKAWDLIRANARDVDEVGRLVTMDAVRGLDPRRVAAALGVEKPKGGYSQLQLDRAVRDLDLSLRAYFIDQADNAMTEPRARERAMLRLGTKAGTAAGTAVELIMQFKSFPLTVITRQINPARRGVGGVQPVAAMAHLMLASTALGFMALQAKQIAKGREPRPLADQEGNPNWPLFAASFLQGGGAGIYGDLLMADYTRYGQGFVETLSGPAVGEIGNLVELYSMLIDEEERGSADSQAIRLIANNTPFLNLFYLRTAMDYALLYQLQEWASPGFLQRYERRVEEDQGTRFLVPPSEAVGG